MAEQDIEFVTFDGNVITKSDYRDEIIDKYIQARYDGLTKITDFNIGSEAYYIADLLASLKLEFREQIDTNYKMVMIHTAVGEFLDNYGDRVGVHRVGSSPSVGEVTFTRLNPNTSNNIIIPDGAVVATDDAISFIVTNNGEPVTITSGETSATASVMCEQQGKYTNVEPNTIKLVMGHLGSLVSVNNTSKFTEGEDIEDDDTYRERILGSPSNASTGTLLWYNNISETLPSIHDVSVRKGTVQSERDIIITFNPEDWTETTKREDINNYNEDNSIESTTTGVMTTARADLVDTFNMPKYDVAGIKMTYHLCEKKPILQSDNTRTYLFGVAVSQDYLLDDLKPAIVEVIKKYNDEAIISVEFSPHTLAVLIENNVPGVTNCRIVERTGTSGDYTYSEVAGTINVDSDEVYDIDLTSISDRIVALRFSLDITEAV